MEWRRHESREKSLAGLKPFRDCLDTSLSRHSSLSAGFVALDRGQVAQRVRQVQGLA